jgi:hypothetical protein
MNNDAGDMRRVWALQTAFLACAAVIVFWSVYALDHFVSLRTGEARGFADPFSRYFMYDPAGLSDAIASLAAVNAAVFGIVITVVSIIVQLTAERYTAVARMFLRDPLNIQVAAFYVVACVTSVWISASLHEDYVPRLTLTMMLSLTTGGLVIMAPYFGYVFWFLEPRNIIVRIRRDAETRAKTGALAPEKSACFTAQAKTLAALEELTDITNNSIAGRDKIIASGAVDALKDFAIAYGALKAKAHEAWFSIGPGIRANPDFVAMDPESLAELEGRRTWVEWKVLRQYLSVYNEALGSMSDINYLIAIDTRYIGEAAADADDAELIELVLRFFNSYLRVTLNAKDVRTTYNVLNQYRKFLETLLRKGKHKAALVGAKHLKYYGLVGFEMSLSFVTETVAYDLAAVAQVGAEVGSPVEQDLLKDFLELDRAPFVRGQERALLGVRKAQVKLAAYYLASGQEERARAIALDMHDEPPERLIAVFRELGNVESKEFWEIIDRGRNFEYMPDEHRVQLATFFGWLGIRSAQAKPPA